MSRTRERVEVGYVARAHGVRGELRVVLHQPDSTALEVAETIWLGGEPHRIEGARPVRGAVLIAVAGVGDRNGAEELRGRSVEVARDDLDLDEAEVLLVDLIGCRAELADGTPWGEVVRVEPGVQDRVVIRDGDVERELPLVDAFVLEVDVEAGRVVVDPPEDLPETPVR